MCRSHTSLNNNTHKGILIGRMWDTILVGDNNYLYMIKKGIDLLKNTFPPAVTSRPVAVDASLT